MRLPSQDFGGKMVFYGGVDVQHLLSSGTQEEVQAAVEANIRAFENCGGYIVANSHHSLASIQGRNIEMMCSTARNFCINRDKHLSIHQGIFLGFIPKAIVGSRKGSALQLQGFFARELRLLYFLRQNFSPLPAYQGSLCIGPNPGSKHLRRSRFVYWQPACPTGR